jgi:nicotinate-nucleotide--dimethylbenzimidazole phosphoribosyltransferase
MEQDHAGCKASVDEVFFARQSHYRQIMSSDPLDDFRNLLDQLPAGRDLPLAADAMLLDAGGGLAELRQWLSRWSASAVNVSRPTIAVFAGAHGFLGHGVTAQTDADVRAFVDAAGSGEAALAKLCGGSNIGLKVLELALDHPTADISQQAALDPRGCAATMAFGMEAVAGGNDLLCLSSIGAGGDVAARAVLAALDGGGGEIWADTDAAPHVCLRQAALIDTALGRYSDDNGLATIAEFGGREIAAVAGAIIAARMERVPVVLDGLPALAAAAALHQAKGGSIEHCRLVAKPASGRVAEVARKAGLGWLAERGVGGGPGVESAIAVQMLRLAALLHEA